MNLVWKKNHLLAPYTTYKIGGEALWFTELYTYQDVIEALKKCQNQQLPFYVLGKGSNTLFDDRGFKGAVLLNKMESVEKKGALIKAGSGVSFPKLGIQTAKAGLSGLEFAAGIPGTLGGAVYMNAGAHGQETAQVVQEVDFISLDGEIKTYSNKEIQFDYRSSCFHHLKGILLDVTLKLIPSKSARETQKSHLEKRSLTQPLKDRSCGCVFRNLRDQSIGALIDQLGLKGKQRGGAQISLKHGNFIVNKEKATAKDVLNLIEEIQQIIYEKKGLKLDPEVRYIPYEGF